MHLERFDATADAARVRACHELYLAGQPVDAPVQPPMTGRVFGGWLALGFDEDPRQTWLAATDPDGPVGWYVLNLPERENTHLARVALLVSPPRRRAGIGTALLRHAARQAVRQGRAALTSHARHGSALDAFFHAMGGRPGISEIDRVLRLPAPALAGLRAEADAAAPGYSLLSWDGPAPQDRLGEVAALWQSIGDAPRDAGHEGPRIDAARVRQGEQRVAAQGLRYYTVAAAAPSGELAALTQLAVDPELPEWGLQELTAVARPHRGHRLGLLVKLAMLDLLAAREPQLRQLITGNADGNKHMIAINEALGFQEADRWRSWDLNAAGLAGAVPGDGQS
jgi:GNAT superfamily N-acetyltransferase/RimJ/RimL family protein N-acetyltransferase